MCGRCRVHDARDVVPREGGVDRNTVRLDGYRARRTVVAPREGGVDRNYDAVAVQTPSSRVAPREGGVDGRGVCLPPPCTTATDDGEYGHERLVTIIAESNDKRYFGRPSSSEPEWLDRFPAPKLEDTDSRRSIGTCLPGTTSLA